MAILAVENSIISAKIPSYRVITQIRLWHELSTDSPFAWRSAALHRTRTSGRGRGVLKYKPNFRHKHLRLHSLPKILA